jgi:glutamyl-tRNA synthetase/glutamyl-Q tRNA(Asp) synthetase
MTPVSRFAPAPTGYLHIGHVVNALHVWDDMRARGGRILLRIEDHDRQRCRQEYDAALLEDMAWLGLEWDGPIVRQSERDAVYREVAATLAAQGLVYGCTCSRHSVYPGTCREAGHALTDTIGWRVRLPKDEITFEDRWCGLQRQTPAAQCGDLLIRDRLGNWTYQFVATVDDHLQGVTDIIRGRDLLDSTGRQIQLGQMIGRTVPAAFAHHGLVMKSPTQKVSKSDGDTGIRDLRAAGWSPVDVWRAARQARLA